MEYGVDNNWQKKKIKVLFFLPWLGGGGAERTFLNIINNIDRVNFDPSLVLTRKRGSYLEMLRQDVAALGLDIQLRFAVVPLARKIRQLKPDIVISTTRFANLVAVLAAKLSARGPRVIVRETNNLTAAGINTHNFLERVVGWSYRNADKVVSLSEGVKNDAITRYGILRGRVRTIYNPIDIDHIHFLARQEPGDKGLLPGKEKQVFNVLGVGKLFYQKGFDLLIKAIDKLRALPVRLVILGEGPERERLSGLIRELELQDRVHMPGFKKNPYAHMARSDLFVLSSRWEGFGHVIAEAMACRVAVLSTKCPSGPDEIITHGKDGRLCAPGSAADLAFHIKKLYEDTDSRKRYIAAASESVKRFAKQIIVKQYENLFESLQGPGGKGRT